MLLADASGRLHPLPLSLSSVCDWIIILLSASWTSSLACSPGHKTFLKLKAMEILFCFCLFFFCFLSLIFFSSQNLSFLRTWGKNNCQNSVLLVANSYEEICFKFHSQLFFIADNSYLEYLPWVCQYWKSTFNSIYECLLAIMHFWLFFFFLFSLIGHYMSSYELLNKCKVKDLYFSLFFFHFVEH